MWFSRRFQKSNEPGHDLRYVTKLLEETNSLLREVLARTGPTALTPRANPTSVRERKAPAQYEVTRVTRADRWKMQQEAERIRAQPWTRDAGPGSGPMLPSGGTPPGVPAPDSSQAGSSAPAPGLL